MNSLRDKIINEHKEEYYNNAIEVSNQDFLGIILDYDDDTNIAVIEERNYFEHISGLNIKAVTAIICPFI